MGVEKAAAGVDRLPVPVEGADDLDLTPAQRQAFMEYIAADQGCSVKDACLAAGIPRKVVRRLRREDALFEEDYRTARGYGPVQVMDAMKRLAIDGVEEPLVSAGKVVVDEATGKPLTVTKYSDRLLEALYKTGTQEGAPLLGPKVSVEIDVDARKTVQRGVPLSDVAKVLLDAGVDLPALAAGDEVEGEIVDVTDD